MKEIPKIRGFDNYKVIDNNKVLNKRCIVLFSSNGLYFPNTDYELQKIINKDKYEWENIAPCREFSRVILLRDVYKQWYINGINENYNSIEKLASLLEGLTSGYETVFVGSSAGGYAAALLGTLVGADFSICFAAQFNLNELKKDKVKNKLLYEMPDYPYFDITKFAKNTFYFLPEKSNQDFEQYKQVKGNKDIKVIRFNSNIHGIPFKPYAIKKVLLLPKSKLAMLADRSFLPTAFSLRFVTVSDFYRYYLIKLNRLVNKFKW